MSCLWLSQQISLATRWEPGAGARLQSSCLVSTTKAARNRETPGDTKPVRPESAQQKCEMCEHGGVQQGRHTCMNFPL